MTTKKGLRCVRCILSPADRHVDNHQWQHPPQKGGFLLQQKEGSRHHMSSPWYLFYFFIYIANAHLG